MQTFWEWLSLLEAAEYIDVNEYLKRLTKLGWRAERSGSHIMLFAPDGIGKVNITVNNWEKNWRACAQDLRARAKNGGGGYPDLDFVFQNPFVIPPNFDTTTQSVRQAATELTIPVNRLLQDPSTLNGRQIRYNGQWVDVYEAGHSSSGTGIDVLLYNGDVITFDRQQQVTIKAA